MSGYPRKFVGIIVDLHNNERPGLRRGYGDVPPVLGYTANRPFAAFLPFISWVGGGKPYGLELGDTTENEDFGKDFGRQHVDWSHVAFLQCFGDRLDQFVYSLRRCLRLDASFKPGKTPL